MLHKMSAVVVYYSFLSSTFLYFETFSYNTQPAITCSKLTIETLEQGVKYAQS